jgi:endo-beta-N-acetylglucosaminidase D
MLCDTSGKESELKGYQRCRLCRNRTALTALPFCSTFNRGAGKHYCMNGKAALQAPWINLSLQDVQPQWLQRGGDFSEAFKAPFQQSQTPIAYEGSGGFRCSVRLQPGAMWLETLFTCGCQLPQTLDVAYTCASGSGLSLQCGLLLYLSFPSVEEGMEPSWRESQHSQPSTSLALTLPQ